MSAEEKEHLLAHLVDTHQSVLAALARVDLEMPVYKESGWRARDILGHIAIWDREVAKALRAHAAGSEYLIPEFNDEGEFNANSVREQRQLSTQQILNEFESAYSELRDAVVDISAERFPGGMQYPWGDESGSITQLVEYMIEHAVEHRDEITKAA